MYIDQIASATAKDEDLQTFFNVYTRISEPHYEVRQELSKSPHGVLLRGFKKVIPKSLQSHTLMLAD